MAHRKEGGGLELLLFHLVVACGGALCGGGKNSKDHVTFRVGDGRKISFWNHI